LEIGHPRKVEGQRGVSDFAHAKTAAQMPKFKAKS